MGAWLTGFTLGFAGMTTAKTVKYNKEEAAKFANADFAERQKMFASSDQNALYADWKKHGPRFENGYFVPMD